jgi:hypothetical protein
MYNQTMNDASMTGAAIAVDANELDTTAPLAKRLGQTVHESVLDRRLRGIRSEFPSPSATTIEAWLLDVANARGACIVQRDGAPGREFAAPPREVLRDEDLVTAICMLQRRDHPQMLRAAAQLVSRGTLDLTRLLASARRERAGVVLGELARQALRVAPEHAAWRALADAFPRTRPLCSPVIHWQRLAWPVMSSRGYNAQRWELVQ